MVNRELINQQPHGTGLLILCSVYQKAMSQNSAYKVPNKTIMGQQTNIAFSADKPNRLAITLQQGPSVRCSKIQSGCNAIIMVSHHFLTRCGRDLKKDRCTCIKQLCKALVFTCWSNIAYNTERKPFSDP